MQEFLRLLASPDESKNKQSGIDLVRLATHPEHPTIYSYSSRRIDLPDQFHPIESLKNLVSSHRRLAMPSVFALGILVGLVAGVPLNNIVNAQDLAHQGLLPVPSLTNNSDSIKRGTVLDEPIRIDVEQQLQNYLVKKLAEIGAEKFNRTGKLIRTEPVQITVTEPMGMWVKDFPHADPKFSRRVRTGKPNGEAQFKAVYYDPDKPLEGLYGEFIETEDKNFNTEVWAVRGFKEGDGVSAKIRYEFFPVRFEDKWLAEFTTEDSADIGKRLSGDQLFKDIGLDFTPKAKVIQ